MERIIMQITSGRGPVECSRVVAKVEELLLKDGRKKGIGLEVLEHKKGDLEGTLLSATLLAKGTDLEAFLKEWRGTVQWIAPSPYRKFHRRKNWFVGVETFDLEKDTEWDPRDVVLQTCRSSGPGGQHVNKVETAVRGTHIPSGIQVMASDSRSQWQNKKLCLERLEAKVLAWQAGRLLGRQQSQWQEHNALERGNAVRTFTGNL